MKSSRILLSPTTEPVKYLEVKSQRLGGKSDSLSIVRASQVPSFQQLKDIAFPSSLSALQTALRPVATTTPPQPPPFPSSSASRPASPAYSRRPSPPRSATPVFSRGVIDSLRKSNELLSQEVSKLQNHLKTLKQKCDFQDEEIKKLQKNAKEASFFAAEQSSKCRVAREAVKSFTSQLNEIVQKMPSEFSETENLKAVQTQALAYIEGSANETSESQTSLPTGLQTKQQNFQNGNYGVNEATTSTRGHKTITLDPTVMGDLSQAGDNATQYGNLTPSSDATETAPKDGLQVSNGPPSSGASEQVTNQGTENGAVEKPPKPEQPPSSESMPNQSRENGAVRHQASIRNEGSRESIEQFEPGVYVTFIQLRNGTKVFRRVRFSKRRFAETQAEEWWKENKDRVLRKYVPPPQNNAIAASSSGPPPNEDESNEPTSSPLAT